MVHRPGLEGVSNRSLTTDHRCFSSTTHPLQPTTGWAGHPVTAGNQFAHLNLFDDLLVLLVLGDDLLLQETCVPPTDEQDMFLYIPKLVGGP